MVEAKPDQDTEVKSAGAKIALKIPKGAVSEATRIELTEKAPIGSSGSRMVKLFELNASLASSGAKVTQFEKELQITLSHDPKELAGLDTSSLRLYYLDEKTRGWVPVPSQFDRKSNTLTATLTHFTNFGEQANPLESGPGRVMAAQVNLQSGTATFSYPIELPPGPGGFQPRVELAYNSGSADEMKNKRSTGSWAGLGWSLHLGRISRDLVTEKYYLDLNGVSYEITSTDSIDYHTVPEQYLKITRSSNTWDVWDKSGTHYQFGGTADSRQYTFDTEQKYYRWDLNLIQDTNNNTATVSYTRDLIGSDYVRAAYPEYLRYNFDRNNNALIEVRFISSYDENDPTDGFIRKDNPKSYGSNPAPKIMETRKLDSIEVKVSNNLIRKYGFAYNSDTSRDRVYSSDYGGTYYSGKPKLLGITQYGKDGVSMLPSLSFTYQDLATHRHTSDPTYVGNPGNPANFNWPHLTQIDSGYGGSISFSYTQIPDTSVLATWTREAATAKTIKPGIGVDEYYTYAYTGSPQYLGTGWDQQYRGFGQTRETDAAGDYVDHYFYTTGTVNGQDAEKLTGREYKTQWFDSKNVLLRGIDSSWSWAPGPGSAFHYVYLTQEDETIAERTVRVRYGYDAYGNVITEYHDGDLSTISDDYTVWRAFYPNTSAHILNKLARERVFSSLVQADGSGPGLRAETLFYYDGHGLLDAIPTQGNLTRLEKKASASSSVSASFTYDAYGNKLSDTDGNGNLTSWTYDTAYHTYPVTKTYPITGLAEAYTYDPGTNNLLTSTDVNGQVTTYTYDVFHRLASEDRPLGQSPDVTYEYRNWGTINQQAIKKTIRIDASTSLWQTDYFDGLGRVVQTQSQGESGHAIISKTTAYDSRGMVEKQYLPQEKDFIPDRYVPPAPTWKGTSYSYDDLRRATGQTNADGTRTSRDYSLTPRTTTTNERGFQTTYTYDAFGRLVQVSNPYPVATGPAADVTASSATVSGSLIDMKGSSSVTVSFEYGPTASYGSATSTQALAAPGDFTAGLTGLSVNTLYYFRAKAVYQDASVSYGADRTFRTTDNGWLVPSGYVEVTDMMANPQNAYLSDNTYASTGTGSNNKTAVFKDFNILDTLPVGTAITGIQVSLEGYRGYGEYLTTTVYLSVDGGASYPASRQSGTITPYEGTVTAGSSTDLWGRSWYYTDFSNANFRVKLSDAGYYPLYLDQIKVKVWYSLDATAPTVTINQASGQEDPTTSLPVLFTVVFSEPVYGFEGADVTIIGTAGGTKTAMVSGAGSTYTVAVNGVTSAGTVTASIAAGRVTDAAGNVNAASTSSDNTVTLSSVQSAGWFAPSGYAEVSDMMANPQNAYLSDNTYASSSGSSTQTAVFKDFSILDTLPGATITGIVVSLEAYRGGEDYVPVSVYLSTDGGATYPASRQSGTIGGGETAVTAGSSTDFWGRSWSYTDFSNGNFRVKVSNTIYYPLYLDQIKVKVYFSLGGAAPTVTINQASGQEDPTTSLPVLFTVVFSKPVLGFEAADVTISGTAGGTKTVKISGTGPTYTVAVNGVTSAGTVTASIAAGRVTDAAGNANAASTSSDDTVTLSSVVSAGWFAPGGYVEVSGMMSNPQNAYASDNTYAVSNYEINTVAVFKDFNILDTLPVGAIITGIQVSLEAYRPGWNVPTGVSLSVDGGTSYPAAQSSGYISGVEGTTYAGSSTSLWGRSWYYTELSNTSFRVKVSEAPYQGTLYLDQIKVKVWYSLDTTAPTVTVNQASGQEDGTTSLPVLFTMVFSERVYGFEAEDVTISGTAGGQKTVRISGSGPTYTVAVSGVTSAGTVIADIAAGRVTDAVGQANAASTSTDNTVTLWSVQSAGWFAPSGYVEVTDMMANPQNAYLSDNIYATSAYSSNKTAVFKGFNILDTLPVGAIITGITVILEGYRDGPSGTASVYLSADGGTSYPATQQSGSLGYTETTVYAGSSTNLWGRSWSYADFSNANFRVKVVEPPSQSALHLDQIKVRVNFSFDTTAPTVTVNQASGQEDPTTSLPVLFTVVFSEPVYGFEAADVNISGDAGGTKTVKISGSGPTYTVAVSGLTSTGTVTASIDAGKVTDAVGRANAPSTSTDDTVTVNWVRTAGWFAPTGYTEATDWVDPQKAYLSDNTYASSSPGTGTETGVFKDFNILDTLPVGATINGITVGLEGYRPSGQSYPTYVYLSADGGASYTAAQSSGYIGWPEGTVYAGSSANLWGRSWYYAELSNANFRVKVSEAPNPGMLYLDQIRVKVDYSFDTTGPTVTINQASGQEDPSGSLPVLFTVVFSEPVYGFEGEDVTISGTAGGTKTVKLSGTGPTYTVAVNGVTSAGTVIASIAAGRVTDAVGQANTASTSSDNTVTLYAVQSAGWFAPTGYTEVTDMMASPQNVYLSDNTYATSTYSSNKTAVFKDFNILDTLPVGATITGIQVSLEAYREGSATTYVYLSADGGTSYTAAQQSGYIGYTEGTVYAGSSTNLWGRSWYYTELSNANFRVKVSEPPSQTALYLDAIKVKVYHSATSIPGQTSTSYTYDVLGNLKTVTDALGNQTTMGYDWLSRKTAMTDPDMGSWSYVYDNNGNVTSQTDAKSQTITFEYDALGRLTAKKQGGTPFATFSYDSTSGGNKGKGQRTGMSDGSGSMAYVYDARGWLVQEQRTVDSTAYTTSYTYDGADRQSTITYPTGEVATQGYNGRGLPYSLSSSASGTIVSAKVYSSLGLAAQLDLGNNTRTTFGYWGTGGAYDTTGGYYGRLWEIKTVKDPSGTPVTHQDVKHTWDAGGNLAQRQDVVAAETETFGYDTLDRLTAASGPYTESYAYNQIGNLTSKNGAAYTYGAKPHAVTQVGATSYAYDANGNMTARGSQTLIWDVENRLTGVTGAATFVYDGTGFRVKKTEGGQTILYVNQYYEKNLSSGVVTLYYYLGGKLVAYKEGTDLRYVAQDHLTGTAVTSDASGNSVGTIKYKPYGETRSSTGTLPGQKFTGQRLDGTGLYYYGARYYDAGLGRFISADTRISDFNNPQAFNRYSYVINNPLRYNDPTGHWPSLAQVGEFLEGIGDAAVNTVEATAQMIVDPVQTAEAIGYAATHPVQTVQAITASYAEKTTSARGIGEIVGEIAITVAVSAVSSGVGAGTKAAQASRVAAAASIASRGPAAAGVASKGAALQRAVQLGKAGEEAAQIIKNTERIDALVSTASYRVPDVLNRNSRIIGEVKNAANLPYTAQLRDYAAFAQQKGYVFELTIRQSTRLSGPLQDAIKAGDIVLRYLPW